MRITFELPSPAAELLLRLAAHIRAHAGTEPSCDAICQSMIVDLLIDDAVAHRAMPGSDRLQ